jgi:hypothetical protein
MISPERFMHVGFGLKAHSGWAALVIVGRSGGGFSVVDRRRLELVDARDASWAKQPYHAAEGKPARDARHIVRRGLRAAHHGAVREIGEAVARVERDGHTLLGCAVLIGQPMPDWSVDEILAVHFRMHKAEGVMFRDALARAARECGQWLVEIPEKSLEARAREALGATPATLASQIATLGKAAGPPWGKDQKEAALAAMIALSRV